VMNSRRVIDRNASAAQPRTTKHHIGLAGIKSGVGFRSDLGLLWVKLRPSGTRPISSGLPQQAEIGSEPAQFRDVLDSDVVRYIPTSPLRYDDLASD
jgi:hypothetical protein